MARIESESTLASIGYSRFNPAGLLPQQQLMAYCEQLDHVIEVVPSREGMQQPFACFVFTTGSRPASVVDLRFIAIVFDGARGLLANENDEPKSLRAS